MICDSGNRTEFETGAVRDLHGEDKGRCDLMPLDVVAEFFDPKAGKVFHHLAVFAKYGNWTTLLLALEAFCELRGWNHAEMALEASIHYRDGSEKYGPDNWQKGIPLRSYLDSSCRHLLKYLRGDQDEPHDRAFCWNMLSACWTCKHKPELNEYKW